jgi:hypothetical protein
MMFIVQGKPREPEGIEKATADCREEALETASDFLNRGFPFVTVVADGRVYTVDEFAMTLINGRKHRRSVARSRWRQNVLRISAVRRAPTLR